MVDIIALKCPQCNANIEIESGRKNCFCTYCGTPIFLDDGSKTITYHTVDEARIQEDQTNRILKLKEYEHEEQKNKLSAKIKLYLLIGWVISLILFIILSVVTVDNVGFSIYQILLILDIILGIKVIQSIIKDAKNK